MQHARPVGPTTTNNAAPFGQEMAQGARPDSAPERRSWFRAPHRAGWHSAQTTHVQATFTPSMSAGYKPDKLPELRPKFGWNATPPDVDRFDSAMVQGWQPSKPRLFFAPRLEEPLTAHTHVTAFSQEQAQGSRPDRYREFLPLRIGWHSSQLTHVAAALSPEMVSGYHPDTKAKLDLRSNVGWVTPDLREFSNEMVYGWHPDSPSLFLPPRIPLPLSQTTHVENAFTVDQIQGAKPDRYRQLLPPRSSYAFIAPDVFAFSVEMVQGSRPDSPRLFLAPRIPLPWSQTTHVQNAFSPDMVAGWRPDKQGYSDLRVRTGAFSQMIDVPFTPEYIQGWHPDSPLRFKSNQLAFVAPPDVQLFSVEMVIGSRPDQPRLFYAPRFYQSPSQLTHVQNAFTLDMVRGWSPDRNRELLPPRSPYAFVPPDVFAFSIEMIRGSRPDRPVLLLGAKIPQPVSQTTHVQSAFTQSMITGERGQRFRQRLGPKTYGAIPPDVLPFTIEMAIGSKPDRPRIFLAPRFQQPPSQTTHVQAAFTPSMSQGSQPPRNREYLPVKIAWQTSQPTFVEFIGPEMFAGSHPDRSRDWLPLKLGWIKAQTTHDANAFTQDMVQGSMPAQPRLFLHPNPRLYRMHWGDELKTLTFVIADVVLDLTASAVTLQDLPASAVFVLDMDGTVIRILDLSGSEDDD